MRKTAVGLLFLLLCSFGIAAQTIRLRPAARGQISVIKGGQRAVIRLSTDIAGCAYVPADYQPDLNKKGCTAPAATFKLIDAAFKNNQTFLVVQAEAMGNCNVCGRCGASEALTLLC